MIAETDLLTFWLFLTEAVFAIALGCAVYLVVSYEEVDEVTSTLTGLTVVL